MVDLQIFDCCIDTAAPMRIGTKLKPEVFSVSCVRIGRSLALLLRSCLLLEWPNTIQTQILLVSWENPRLIRVARSWLSVRLLTLVSLQLKITILCNRVVSTKSSFHNSSLTFRMCVLSKVYPLWKYFMECELFPLSVIGAFEYVPNLQFLICSHT